MRRLAAQQTSTRDQAIMAHAASLERKKCQLEHATELAEAAEAKAAAASHAAAMAVAEWQIRMLKAELEAADAAAGAARESIIAPRRMRA